MSMICGLIAVSPGQIRALREMPRLASDLVQVVLTDGVERTMRAQLQAVPADKRAGVQAQMEAAFSAMRAQSQADPALAAARSNVEKLGPLAVPLDIEKSWHLLHYLMTGHVDASPAPGDALLTGEPLGEDVGYGPPRLHDAEATRRFADFLASQDLTRLQQRVNMAELRRLEVYALPWADGVPDAEFEGDLRNEVASYFPLLKDYVQRTAKDGSGLLIWLS